MRAARATDLAAILAVMNACDVAELGHEDHTEADLRAEWGWPRFELERDAWVTTGPSGDLTGYGWVWERTAAREYDGHVFARPGIEATICDALVPLLESRAHARAQAAPVDLVIPCASTNVVLGERLARRGYATIRSFFRMGIDLAAEPPPANPPSGVLIRTVRRGSDDTILWALMQDAFADHFRFTPESFEDWSRRTLAHGSFAPDLSHLALHQDAAVAASINFLVPRLGWVGMLGVRHAWRGKRLGMALLRASFAGFRRAGLPAAALGVDAENADGAVRLYERAGMRVTQRIELFSKRLDPA